MAEEFSLNNRVLVEVDSTPLGASRTWLKLANGIMSAIESHNDSTDDTAYLPDGGYGNSDIIGKQYTVAITGHRVIGNPAQDYIVSLQGEFGDDAKTYIRYTKPNGYRTQARASVAEIVDSGGDANAKTDFSCNFKGCGAPTITQPTSAPALTATIATGSVVGTTKFTATADPVTNTLAYKVTPSARTANLYAHSVGLIAYTSGADIPATVGQSLNMYELDSNGRVAKFKTEVLEAADINPGT
jgi:hypothetical protein